MLDWLCILLNNGQSELAFKLESLDDALEASLFLTKVAGAHAMPSGFHSTQRNQSSAKDHFFKSRFFLKMENEPICVEDQFESKRKHFFFFHEHETANKFRCNISSSEQTSPDDVRYGQVR